MVLGDGSKQNVNFILTIDIFPSDYWVDLYLYSNSNLTFRPNSNEKEEFLFSGVAFVVYLGNHLAIVTTNYDLNIYKYSICDRTTEDPIYTLPDVQKIHYTEYGYKLLVLKTNGKLYHLSKVDDDMILLYISDNVIDMYSDHFICTGLNL